MKHACTAFVITLFCLCLGADENPICKGMTWVVRGQNGPFVQVGQDATSNPYLGDTSCAEDLPILAIKVTGAQQPGIEGVQYDYYQGWCKGYLQLTPPVKGSSLTSLDEADRIVRQYLGEGWRMAEFHDGGGGWAYWGIGELPKHTRFWVYINDQKANPWNSSEEAPLQPAPPQSPNPVVDVEQKAFSAEESALQVRAVLERYLKLPFPQEDRLAKARDMRLQTLEELKSFAGLAVREIARILPGVTDPRQRVELAEALGFFPMKAAADTLGKLLADSDTQIRQQAIADLWSMAKRVDRLGAQRVQRGKEFAPQVKGLVPQLIKAAGDKDAGIRALALFALADTLDPDAIAEIRRRLQDESADVRFNAACLLTEFKDASGLGELKEELARLRSKSEMKPAYFSNFFHTELLLASFERITGKSFGPIPMVPWFSSDSRKWQEYEPRYRLMLDAWAAWWAQKGH